jgi:hypothetical protein
MTHRGGNLVNGPAFLVDDSLGTTPGTRRARAARSTGQTTSLPGAAQHA